MPTSVGRAHDRRVHGNPCTLLLSMQHDEILYQGGTII